jgi:GntR family transcriptional repressor for pyruvate dehydrogenase complex
MFDPQPVRRPREQVEGQLRDAILEGTFKQGEKLPSELELASRFGVSRTTIREALRSLASDGLVRKVPGATGGSFVLAIDHRALGGQIRDSVDTILRLGTVSMPELVQVRKFLEVPSARLAATHRTDEHLAELRGFVDDVKRRPLADPHIDDIDVQFHSTIADASGNRLLSAFISALHEVTHPVRYLEFSAETGRQTVLQHIAIVRAIETRDPAAAADAMREHLQFLEELPTHEPSDNDETVEEAAVAE